MSSSLHDNIQLPNGPPPRVVIFLPGTRGLEGFAEWIGVRTRHRYHDTKRSEYDIAADVNLVMFGYHPDFYRKEKKTIRMILGSEGGGLEERASRCGAPSGLHGRELLQWYMESSFPADEADDADGGVRLVTTAPLEDDQATVGSTKSDRQATSAPPNSAQQTEPAQAGDLDYWEDEAFLREGGKVQHLRD